MACATMLVLDKAEYVSGFKAISLHAEEATFPELNPGPSVPKPVHIPAPNRAKPVTMLDVDVLSNNKQIKSANIIGVSIMASLIIVNENIFP